MNRRGFLRAVGATGLGLLLPDLVAKPSRVEEQIRQALSEQRLLEFTYHGYARRVEPHALGHATENRPALLAWQVAGGSQSEPPPGWRTFLVAELENLKLAAEKFRPRPDYHPERAKLKDITLEVGAPPAGSD